MTQTSFTYYVTMEQQNNINLKHIIEMKAMQS